MNACRAMSGQLARVTMPAFLAMGALLVALMYLVFFSFLPGMRKLLHRPKFEVVDAYYIRPPSVTFANLEELGVEGRKLYLKVAAADTFVPLFYATLLGAWVAWAWRVSPTPRTNGLALSCWPLCGKTLDLPCVQRLSSYHLAGVLQALNAKHDPCLLATVHTKAFQDAPPPELYPNMRSVIGIPLSRALAQRDRPGCCQSFQWQALLQIMWRTP